MNADAEVIQATSEIMAELPSRQVGAEADADGWPPLAEDLKVQIRADTQVLEWLLRTSPYR